jgi:hypothetical protein
MWGMKSLNCTYACYAQKLIKPVLKTVLDTMSISIQLFVIKYLCLHNWTSHLFCFSYPFWCQDTSYPNPAVCIILIIYNHKYVYLA